jgi:hypothetical protein
MMFEESDRKSKIENQKSKIKNRKYISIKHYEQRKPGITSRLEPLLETRECLLETRETSRLEIGNPLQKNDIHATDILHIEK